MMSNSMLIENNEIIIEGKMLKIASFKSEWYKVIDNQISTIDALKRDNNGVDIFTFVQKPPETTPKYDYYMERENAAVIQIISFNHWWTEQTTKNNRKRVRKAQNRGVEVKLAEFNDEFVQGIIDIYNESPIRQGRRFWHYGKDFETVEKENSTFLERSDFIGAYYNNELVGFIKLVYTGKCADMMQIISKIACHDKYVTNALIAKAVEICDKKKIQYLIYGNFFYGKKETDTLTIFKTRNGFQKIDFPRYYIPLTLKGKIALKLHLHHHLTEMLPKSIIIPLLNIRSKWSEIRYGNQKENVEAD